LGAVEDDVADDFEATRPAQLAQTAFDRSVVDGEEAARTGGCQCGVLLLVRTPRGAARQRRHDLTRAPTARHACINARIAAGRCSASGAARPPHAMPAFSSAIAPSVRPRIAVWS
jgi:hypothetical protein